MVSAIVINLTLLAAAFGSEWSLRKEKSGIEVYTRQVEGSSFSAFMGVVQFENTGVDEVVKILFDVDNFETLFPDCIESKLVETTDPYHKIHYTVTKGPWPVWDRDAVFEQEAAFSKDRKKVRVVVTALPEKLEKSDHRIRIEVGSGYWDIEGMPDNAVRITFRFHGEPGGEIPAWLANSFVVSYPYKTLENLRNRLVK